WSVEDSKFVISRDVTFDEKSIVALSKAMKPNYGDVMISNNQVIEIESEDQPDSSRDRVENPIASEDISSEDEEEDGRDHEGFSRKIHMCYNNNSKNLWMPL
ncbi:hypothetical protein A2U01_0070844, partial [Trifolium medium]|nr:hypothetical protein [Trifolium medium]